MRQSVLVLHPSDNVATALVELDVGQTVTVERESGAMTVCAQEPIAFGHKIALVPIAAGASVYKYGEVIGVAAADIPAGAHVHVHNVESQRGRGDLAPAPASGGAGAGRDCT